MMMELPRNGLLLLSKILFLTVWPEMKRERNGAGKIPREQKQPFHRQATLKEMKFNKKGMSAEFLVGLIITLVAGGLLMWTAYSKLAQADEKQAEVICQESINFRAISALQINKNDRDDIDIIEAEIKSPVLCKTIDKKIKGSKEEIMEQMANKMARCWWMFGEGRYDEILHSSDVKILPAVLGMSNEPNKCFNCYNILIDQDEIKDKDGNKIESIKTEEFLHYLWDTPYVKKVSDCERTECVSCRKDNDCISGASCKEGKCQIIDSLNYIQYIQQYGGPGMMVTMMPDIKPHQGYAISILPKTREQERTNWLKLGGITVAGTAALACTIGTGGACFPLVLAVGKIGLGAAVIGTGYDIIQENSPPESPSIEGSGTTLDRGAQVSIETMFEERRYSSIYLSDIQTGQRFCGSGDLAGE